MKNKKSAKEQAAIAVFVLIVCAVCSFFQSEDKQRKEYKDIYEQIKMEQIIM